MNNLPRVATLQCTDWESNLRPLDHKSNALTTTLPSHPGEVGEAYSSQINCLAVAFKFLLLKLSFSTVPELLHCVNVCAFVCV